ncbi:MAG TPA: acid phosphatase, partial [Candidatus Limnocylindrales bacterium]|nr:acid phosphatase [Candidatus Limnocylindrales bacterium]
GVAGLSAAALTAKAGVSFLGVAAGDASSQDAILWTRAVDTNALAIVALTAQVSTDPGFGSYLSFATSTDTTKDYTAKVAATGLAASTKYYYRFTDGIVTSLAGTFKTAPNTNTAAAVSFAFSGDCDGLIRPYALASQIPAKNLDFFMFDGDTIYETSASIGSPAVTSTTSATKAQLFTDFSRKYRQQFLPVNPGGQNCLQSFFAGQGNYTAYDNHELGNKQYINGGAPAGAAISTDPVNLPTGTGFAGKPADNADTNVSGPFINKSAGFQTLQQVYMNYQPVKERGTISALSDPRTDGTRQLYFAQPWGKNVLFVNVDDRTYRDIRLKLSDGSTDDTSTPRADNTNRTMLGATQLAWLEQTLLAAQQAGTPWKFINISDPIDEIGPIGGALTLNNAPTTADYGTLGSITSVTTTVATTSGKTVAVTSTVGLVVGQPVTGTGVPANTTISAINTDGVTFTVNNNSTIASGATLTLAPAASTYAPVSADGGKSWMGGYRRERNALFKFIADNKIRNVVFLTTDDHQNRINELTYSPTGDTGNQSSYVKVPFCFEVVCGPLGATGPDFIQNHTFALSKKLADSIANAQVAAGIEPIGLIGYPGLHKLVREGDATAATTPQPVDFYSPDTFNYNKFDVTPDGKTLTITSYGINSTVQNSFPEYDAVNNPERQIFSFQIDAASDFAGIDHFIVIYQENWSFDALYGSFPGANGLSNVTVTSTNQLDRLTGNPIALLLNYDPAANTIPTQNPPVPLNGTQDKRFLTDTNNVNSPTVVNTLLPYDLSGYIAASDLTGDIVHRYWQEQFQIDGGKMDDFVTWSDNPGLVMSYFDASQMPEGKLAQQYTMCDNFFHSAFGGSFLNHQFFIAAQAPVYPNAATLLPTGIAILNTNGVLLLTNTPNAGRIFRDGNITPIGGVVFANTNLTFDKNYAVNTIFSINLAASGSPSSTALLPSQNDSNPGDLVRPYIPTIGDRLDAVGVNWKWYSGGWDRALNISPSNPSHYGTTLTDTNISLFQWHHQAFAFYDNYAPWTNGVRNARSAAHLQDENNFFADVTNNTLPSVVFIKPLGPDNEHPGYASLLQGQLHVSNIVAAVQSNPALWAHTAIIVTYDEHGGRWDHVAPPARDIWGPGSRVPGIIISPLAKTNYVDHTQYETLSFISTIEKRFGIAPLTAADAAAATFAPAFNPALASVVEPSTPPVISFAQSGGQVTLSWPANYVGFYVLQAQTNSLASGIGNDWTTISTGTSNTFNVTPDRSQPGVFYRLIRP